MNKQQTAAALLSSLLFSLLFSPICPALTGGTASAQDAEIRITGSITPPGCTFELTEGNIADFGEIDTADLSPDEITNIRGGTLSFRILCSAPTKIAFTATSARGASAINQDGTASEIGVVRLNEEVSTGVFGVGLQGTKPVGGYSMHFQSGYVNDYPFQKEGLLVSDNSPDHWIVDGYPVSMIGPGVKRYFTWSESGNVNDLVPAALRSVEGNMRIDLYINKTSELDLSKPVRIDGMAMLDMVYL